MSARKGKNLKRVKYQLKSLEEAFERDATARHKNISVRNALIIAQECVDKQIAKPLESWGAYQCCPSCGVAYIFFDNYCPVCGQKIDR
jgi:hypothetical protein|nr:MAG TPA: ribosome, girodazole, girolline, antibiotic complex, 50S [Caudoviricetes sp.]